LNPETTSGGRAIPFYASIRLNVRAGEKIPDPNIKGEDMCHIVNVRDVKNKTARPNKQASFPLIYGVGVDKTSEVADIAVNIGAVEKGGAWLRIKGPDDKPITRKWTKHTDEGDTEIETVVNFNGKDKLVQHLYEDRDFYKLLERVVYGGTVSIEEYMGIAE
jgi:recombination protein RecA